MKRIITVIAVLFSFLTFSQFEDELKILHTACNTAEDSIDFIFDPILYEKASNDTLYIYVSNMSNSLFAIEYSGDMVMANYVEDYSKSRLKDMNKYVRSIAPPTIRMGESIFYESYDYIYLVSNFKDTEDTIVITATKTYSYE